MDNNDDKERGGNEQTDKGWPAPSSPPIHSLVVPFPLIGSSQWASLGPKSLAGFKLGPVGPPADNPARVISSPTKKGARTRVYNWIDAESDRRDSPGNQMRRRAVNVRRKVPSI